MTGASGVGGMAMLFFGPSFGRRADGTHCRGDCGGPGGGGACWLIQESRARSRLAEQEAGHRVTAAGLRGQLETAQKILETAKEQLSETFQATASRALSSNNERLKRIMQRINHGRTLVG